MPVCVLAWIKNTHYLPYLCVELYLHGLYKMVHREVITFFKVFYSKTRRRSRVKDTNVTVTRKPVVRAT